MVAMYVNMFLFVYILLFLHTGKSLEAPKRNVSFLFVFYGLELLHPFQPKQSHQLHQ